MRVSAFCYSKQKCGEFSNRENSSCLWLQDDWNSFREKSLFSCDIYALQTSRKYCFYWTLELLNLCYLNRSISHIIIKNGNSQTACEQGQQWFLGSCWDFKQEDGVGEKGINHKLGSIVPRGLMTKASTFITITAPHVSQMGKQKSSQ